MTTAIYIYTSLVSLITYKGSHSVAGTFDLSLVDLASDFDEVIMTLPSHSGLYRKVYTVTVGTMSHTALCQPLFACKSMPVLSPLLRKCNTSAQFFRQLFSHLRYPILFGDVMSLYTAVNGELHAGN